MVACKYSRTFEDLKFLPDMHAALFLSPALFRLGTLLHISNPSTVQVEMAASEVQVIHSTLRIWSSIEYSENLSSKRRKKKKHFTGFILSYSLGDVMFRKARKQEQEAGLSHCCFFFFLIIMNYIHYNK